MKFEKGRQKTGGRKPGVKNKRTRLGGDDTLAKLVETMEDPDRLKEELGRLHGRDYFQVYCNLQGYLRPKFSSIDFQGEVKVGNEVADALRELTINNEK